jgi:hypothetical protein
VQSQVQAPRESCVDPPPDPPPSADEGPEDQAGDERRGSAEPKPPQQHLASPGLPVGLDGLVEAFPHDLARLVEGIAVVGIKVTLEDPEREESIDVDREPLRTLGHADRAWSIRGEGFTNALAGRRRTLSWLVAEIRAPQGDNVTIEESERGRALRGLGGSSRARDRL